LRHPVAPLGDPQAYSDLGFAVAATLQHNVQDDLADATREPV
jgi:hypothetical protein